MKPHLAVAAIVFWPWLLIATVVLIKGPQLYGLVIGFYIQCSLFWVIPAALLWIIIEIMAAVRNRIG